MAKVTKINPPSRHQYRWEDENGVHPTKAEELEDGAYRLAKYRHQNRKFRLLSQKRAEQKKRLKKKISLYWLKKLISELRTRFKKHAIFKISS